MDVKWLRPNKNTDSGLHWAFESVLGRRQKQTEQTLFRYNGHRSWQCSKHPQSAPHTQVPASTNTTVTRNNFFNRWVPEQEYLQQKPKIKSCGGRFRIFSQVLHIFMHKKRNSSKILEYKWTIRAKWATFNVPTYGGWATWHLLHKKIENWQVFSVWQHWLLWWCLAWSAWLRT